MTFCNLCNVHLSVLLTSQDFISTKLVPIAFSLHLYGLTIDVCAVVWVDPLGLHLYGLSLHLGALAWVGLCVGGLRLLNVHCDPCEKHLTLVKRC